MPRPSMASSSVDAFPYGIFWDRFAMRGRCLTIPVTPDRPRVGAVLGPRPMLYISELRI